MQAKITCSSKLKKRDFFGVALYSFLDQMLFIVIIFFEAVLKRNASVEHEMTGFAVLVVNAEIADPHKLEALGSGGVLQALFCFAGKAE